MTACSANAQFPHHFTLLVIIGDSHARVPPFCQHHALLHEHVKLALKAEASYHFGSFW